MTIEFSLTQEAFGGLVGIGQSAVSRLIGDGVLPAGGTGAEWLLAYCHRLREQAAGRYTEGPLDLSQERAALAREQREGVALKNAVARGEYAEITLLGRTLATASQAVADRFEHLPGQLRKACPDLPPAAMDRVMQTIAEARNEWVTHTCALVSEQLMADYEDDADGVEVAP